VAPGPAQAATPTVALETPTRVALTPEPVAQQPNAIVGYVIEDTDGNGVRSAGDRGAQTLVQMHRLSGGRIVSGASVFSDKNGRFEFADASPGEYLLWVWWTPGFVSLQGGSPAQAVLQHTDLLLLGIIVLPDGTAEFKQVTVRDEADDAVVTDVPGLAATQFSELSVLVNPKPEGLIPWPVAAGGTDVPVGKTTLAGTIALPTSGGGVGDVDRLFPWVVMAVGLAVFVAATAALRLGARRTD